jgi:hypothetical protein
LLIVVDLSKHEKNPARLVSQIKNLDNSTLLADHNAAGFRKLQKSGFSWLFLRLFVTFYLLFVTLFYFLRRSAFILQKPSHCDVHKCNHLWRFCDSLKAVTKKTVIESFKSPSLAGFFVIICDLVYFYTSLAYSTN